MNYIEIFDRLWKIYNLQNPSTKKIYDLFVAEGETVINDHVAFRTFNDSRINIDVISKLFLENGYTFKEEYTFNEKHLKARHYEHNQDKKAPKIFISELILQEFSPYLQTIITDSIDKIPINLIESRDLIFSGAVWGNQSYEIYYKLREESEYAAWLYAFGFRANHFTVSINHLKILDTIEKVNLFIKEKGFSLNTSGGEIKGTKKDLLQQSSTLSEIVEMKFIEGTYKIPGCYYEFALRYNDSEGKLFSGFIADSANKIFESTDFQNKV
jgi:hypothetical protein